MFLQIPDGLQIIGELTGDTSRQELLRGQVDPLAEAVKSTLAAFHDHTPFERRLRQVRRKLLTVH